MQTELLTATMAAMEGFLALRASGGNPNHVSSGEKGGQFTSGGGSGGGHGKHYARRQRKKAKLLAKLKAQGHTKLAKLRQKQRKQKASLRVKHRKEGTSYADRRKDMATLSTKQKGERTTAVQGLKAEIAKEVSSFKVAEGSGRPASTKTAAYKQDREKALGEQRVKDRADRKEVAKELRQEMHGLVKEQRTERNDLRKDMRAERSELRTEQRGERATTISEARESHKSDVRDLHNDYRNTVKESREYAKDERLEMQRQARQDRIDSVKEQREANTVNLHAALKDLREGHKDAYHDLVESQRGDLHDLKAEHASAREDMRKDHHEQRELVKETEIGDRAKLLADLKEKHFPKSTKRGIDDQINPSIGRIQRLHIDGRPRSVGPDGQRSRESVASVGRFGPMATHKASSAPAILKHCLRQHPGWLKRWRDGQLTGRQHLTLLMDVRQYGRAWLRHEMEGFFDAYGNQAERSLLPDNEWFVVTSTRSSEARGQDDGALLLHQSQDGLHRTCRSLSDRLLSPLRRTFDRMRVFVRELIHTAGEAIAGPGMSMDDYTFLDRQADKQDDYLEVFRKEMEANPPREIATPEPIGMPSQTILVQELPRSPAQITARAELYGNSAWQAGQKLNHAKAKRTGGLYERRVLGHPKTEHCVDCPPLAALGWQLIGTLPDIGDSECGGLCLCHFEYSNDPAAPGATKVPGKPPETTRPKGGGQAPVVIAPIKANPTPEEIDAEFKKWKEGKPSAIAIKGAVKPPAWSTEQEEQEFELPPGYEWSS